MVGSSADRTADCFRVRKTSGILAMVAATFLVYSLLFGVGYFLYGQMLYAGISAVIAVVSTLAIVGIWPRLKMGKST